MPRSRALELGLIPVPMLFSVHGFLIREGRRTPFAPRRRHSPWTNDEILDVRLEFAQTPNDSPHPQVVDAFGLRNTKPRPFSPSVKSISVPST